MARRRHIQAWKYEVDGEQLGPLAEPDLLVEIKKGIITPQTKVWRPGLDAWTIATETKLADYFDDAGKITPEASTTATKTELASERVAIEREKVLPPQGQLKSLRVRSFILQVSLAAFTAFCMTFAALPLLATTALQSVEPGALADATTFAGMLEISWLFSAFGYSIFFATSVISYCFFFHRAMHNIWAIRSPHAEMQAGWVWGWHFVPIALLYKPLEGAMQVWRGSMSAAALNPKVPALFGLWWTTWLVGNAATNISARVETENNILGYFDYASSGWIVWLSAVSLFVVGMASAFLFFIVRRISFAQSGLAAGNTADTFS